MSNSKMDGQLFKAILASGAANLVLNYKKVDALNVFPVPDGDTGTNMRMTIEAGAVEVKNASEQSIYEVAKKASRGMLMGARGNSGVILSQLFRGLYKGLAGHTSVNPVELGIAFNSAVQQAYGAVLKPVEGTILTVARESTEYVNKMVTAETTFEEFFQLILEEGNRSLERTPDLLPALKEAGVVDSGAVGYLCVIEGMLKAIQGEPVEATSMNEGQTVSVSRSFNAHSVLEYGYCTEFILQLQYAKVDIANFDIKVITDFLETLGDSIVAIKDEDIVKVHVHTKTPGVVLSTCQQYGEFVTLKIENMSVQHSEMAVSDEECNCDECVEMRKQQAPKKFGVVCVASGEGLVEVFKQMGADYVVEGGQSMNPSAEDFVKGFDSINAENIIVFPNNSNIVLTAEQAAKYYKDAHVYVVKSKTLAQGYSALTMLDLSSGDIKVILEELQGVIANVTTGLITYSIRDAEIEGVNIKKDDYIGICNGAITVSIPNRLEAAKALIETTDIAEKDIITIIYGKDVDEEELASLIEYIEENHSNVEVDTIEGGQNVYSYILSIE